MLRILITGATGFVGSHLCELMQNMGCEIWGTSRTVPSLLDITKKINWVCINFNSVLDIKENLVKIRPNLIFHLAAQSNVQKSWENSQQTFETNVICTINLLESVKEICPETKVVNIGSSEEYGFSGQYSFLDETSITNPVNPYGISKLSAGLLCIQYHKTFNTRVIHVRPFNHIGPGQSIGFVTSDFARQIVSIEYGKMSNPILVGNLNAERDFTDVRDIVNAYWLLAEKGIEGEIYNVCSGKGTKISELLSELAKRSKVEINIKIDESKMRPIDIIKYVGNNEKIMKHTGWFPKISIDKTLDDIIEDWRLRIEE